MWEEVEELVFGCLCIIFGKKGIKILINGDLGILQFSLRLGNSSVGLVELS
jgi:hypothetical protein